MQNNFNRLQKLIEMEQANPADPFLKFAMAQEYIAMGQAAKAKALYELLTTDYAAYIPTYYHLAKMKEDESLFDEAIALYKKGIELAEAAGEKHAANELKAALFAIEE
jgi:tetratricopeptide (TPR) repeat protein